MSKPLELTVYEEYHGSYTHSQLIDGVMHLSFHTPTDSKRLTDPELAAESYRQMTRACAESGMVNAGVSAGDMLIAPGDAATFGPVRLETSRLGELKRFATLPNAADKDYQ